jgi:predicted nuclease of predicted toxin-antitoxin system
MTVKLLLDENISPKVALDLCADGIDAIAVRDRNMLEATDREVFQRAYDEDRIVVTKNRRGDIVNTLLRVAVDGSMTFEPVPAGG